MKYIYKVYIIWQQDVLTTRPPQISDKRPLNIDWKEEEKSYAFFHFPLFPL